MHAPHEVEVSVVSPEEAESGIAELWANGRLFGFTHIQDGELVLTIDAPPDGATLIVGAKSLADALARAKELLSPDD